MRVVAVVEAADHVCCRYRVAAFRPHLEAAGHTLDIRPLPKGFLARLKVLRSVRDADAVILQRKLLSWFEFAALRRNARRLIFDFDDAVWLRDSYSAKGFESRKRRSRFLRTVAGCDRVVAGNRFLASRDREGAVSSSEPHPLPRGRGSQEIDSPRGVGSSAIIIPTCVDPARYPLAVHTRTTDVRLVWLGSSSTLKGLEQQRDLLNTVGRAVPGIRLKVICDRFPTFEHLPVDAVPWREATEATELASADIGIGWVPDDPWSRGKCGLKLIQYHAAGLPVVANPVGVQADMVRNDDTGFIADTPDDWIQAIQALAANPMERTRMGGNGRRQVESAYSVDVGGAAWVKLLEGLR